MKNLDTIFGEGFTEKLKDKGLKRILDETQKEIGDLNKTCVNILREAYKAKLNPVGFIGGEGWGHDVYGGVTSKNKKAIKILKEKSYIEFHSGEHYFNRGCCSTIKSKEGYRATEKGMEIFDKYFRKKEEILDEEEKRKRFFNSLREQKEK